ncbi:hypothetical protein IAD21_02653 [Abditibacteriota bacterium]|nr:hypothetical protein IAD21_02653 [Abditibacteriota bacterium]
MALLYFIGGFAAVHFALRELVPVFMELIGAKHFASRSAFDGCQSGFLGGIIAAGVYSLADHSTSDSEIALLLTFPLLMLACTLCGLLYLRWLGALDGMDKTRGWKLVDGHVFNQAGEEIYPTCFVEESFYNQTGPFSGYTQYFLTLADADNQQDLGTNSYNSEYDFKRDKEQIQQQDKVKWFDLIWLWRAEEKKWLVVHFPSTWTFILCGPLEKLSPDDREWWQHWIFPTFTKHIGTEVNASDALERFERFKQAYVDGNADESFIRFERKLRTLLESEGPVIAFDSEGYRALEHSVVGARVRIGFEAGTDFITLESGTF